MIRLLLRLFCILLVKIFIFATAYTKFHSRSRNIFVVFGGKTSTENFRTLQYDPVALAKHFDQRPLAVWERLVDIGSPILGWWVLRKWENVTAPFRTAQENEVLLNNRAIDFKNSIVQGKSVTFIKSGQALALRPDIVKSPEYVRELQKLQDEVGTFDNDVALEIIRNELGREPEDMYEFDPKLPIASASIGQVYRARNRHTGKLVAVKVQRPDALQTADIDMYILRRIAAFLKARYKLRSDLVGIADEFGKQLYQELDYRQEARNCARFRSLYGNIPGIFVPGVDFNLTSQRVLSMDWVEGVKGPWAVGGERMLTIGLQCSVLQLLDTGFFHADPHRGNLLQTPDGRLAYLDFGMMAEVPTSQRFGLIGTVLGLVNKDLGMVVRNLRDLDFLPPDLDTEVVITALNSAVQNSTINGQGSTMNFTQLSANLQSISYLLPIRFPPFYTLIIRTLTILEGLALFVDPNFRLIRGAYPFIAKQILSSPSPELGDLLRAVIVNKQGRIRWDKLEQFVSVSASADAAVNGDFSALKRAQSRADVQKIYAGGQQESSNVSAEVVGQVLDFLSSDTGRQLREPLVLDIIDSLDSLGLTAASVASVATNGILPRPVDIPDRERVEQLLRLLQLLADRALLSTTSSGSGTAIASSWTRLQTLSGALLKALQERSSSSSLRPILSRLAPIANDVVAGLVERGVRRSVRSWMTPRTVQSQLLPTLGRAIDLAFALAAVPRRILEKEEG